MQNTQELLEVKKQLLGKVIETLKEPPQTIYFQQMQDVEFLSELKLFGRNQNETSGL